MPVDSKISQQTWNRYIWCRDNGHSEFVMKADKCDQFFRGQQWDSADLTMLRMQRRPALTINKVISTIANVMGEQIYARNEIAYRPRSGAPEDTAVALTKVFKQISDNNQLDWKRSDSFADGIITSRGFLDVRLRYNDSAQGEVGIEKLNPKNVIVDPDGEDYDPDTWNDVMITKWLTADDIEVLYNREDAEYLRNKDGTYFPYGWDTIQDSRDRFGSRFAPQYNGVWEESSVMRNIRVIERQHKRLARQKMFLLPATGDLRDIPEEWDRNRIAAFREKLGLEVITKMKSRIRFTVTAGNCVLHDDWSPYEHFTVVPYFPFFRHGHSVGLVENLLGPQELLNKVSSQELHVVNTTANSGWKVKSGALATMTTEELEERGAETGLVIEVAGDPDKDVVKITPNQIPQGLDRISYKAEDHIDTISGVSASMKGFDREDVAAKAIQQKRQAGSTNLAKPLDGLVRSDFILARNILSIVQAYYTEERLLTITHDGLNGQTENFKVNEMTPEGEIINDLTLGEYDVVTSSVPQRETLEDSQFEQAMSMKEQGIQIPDAFIIQASRLVNKSELVKQIQDASNSPEAQKQRQLALRGQAAEVGKTEAETRQKTADAQLKLAKAQKEAQPEPVEDNTADVMKAHADMQLDQQKFGHEQTMDFSRLRLEREKMMADIALKREDQAAKREDARMQAAIAASKPTNSQPGARA